MRKRIKKYLNIYVVLGIIGISSLLYLISYAFILHDVMNGSSLQMKKDKIAKEKKFD